MTGPPGSAEQSAGASPTTAWFHCFAGIAGDMALGSLLDAGADLSEVVALLERLPLRNWRLSTEPVLRAGIAATRALVDVTDDVIVRTHSHIVGLVEEARLPPRVARRALDTFAVLADVEGRLHRRSPSQVHFHEVGSHDTIIDVVGTAAALEVLDVEVVTASAVATGTGTVRTAHGFLPNPSPAVVRLLEGIPTWGRDIPVELTTPTGAALLAAMATGFGPLPPMRIASSGFGAGSNEIDGLPNCTQVGLGESQAVGPARPAARPTRGESRRRHRRDPGPRRRGPPRRGRPRRLDHPGHHEEGPARLHRHRPRRPRPRRIRSPCPAGGDGEPRRPGHRPGTLAGDEGDG